MIRIALDLELEQPKTNSQCPDSLLDEEKIIQVGWVVFDSETMEIHEERCFEINIGVPISRYIQTLTRITNEQIENGKTLENVYQVLYSDRERYNASRTIAQWGCGDIDCLRKELGTSISWAFGRSGLNTKHLYQVYAEANGLNSSGGLSKVLGKLGLKWLGQGRHNALNDAKNTAQVYSFLMNKMKSKP